MTKQESAAIARAAKMAKQPPLTERFWSKVNITNADECWEWLASVRRSNEGYGAFWYQGRHQPASRMAWILTNGGIPGGLQVLHKCDNPKCCNPSHLFLGTNRENNQDKVNKQRHAFGSRNGFSKLTEQQVAQIKGLIGSVPIKNIAIMFDVTAATIYDIKTRRWLHVEAQYA